MSWYRHTILSKIYWEQGSHIFFVWNLDFSIISSYFDRAKVFTVSSNLTTQSTFSVCCKKLNESYVFLLEFVLCLQKCSFCSAFLYYDISFMEQLRDLRFSMVQQFLSRLPTIRSQSGYLLACKTFGFIFCKYFQQVLHHPRLL